MRARQKIIHHPLQPQSEAWYDLDFDRDLILQSIAKQYHILPSEQEELHYSDWYQLLAGIMEDTPLGQAVIIRKENNKKLIEKYSENEKRIRREWNEFRCSKIISKATEESKKSTAEYFEKLFSQMF